MLRTPGLRKSVEQPVLDLNFATSQIGANAAPDSRINFSRGSNAWFVDSDGVFKKSPHNLLLNSETIGGTGWTGGQSGTATSTITLNHALAPNGTLTATKVDFSRGSTPEFVFIKPIASIVATGLVQGSCYIKAASSSDVGKEVHFWQFTTSPSAGIRNQSIATLTSEWQRFELVNTYSHTGVVNEALAIGFINNVGSELNTSVLLWGAQLSQHSTPPVDNPYLKTTGSAVYAARLDHDPTWLMSAAQEQNLLQYSETIDDSYWNKIRTTVTANAIEAPDGTVTAELLSEDSSANQTHVVRQNTITDIPQTAGKSYVFSGYVKAGGRNRVRIRFEHAAHQADLLLNNGTFFNNGFDSVTFTDVGNGWFRFVAVETADSREPLVQIMLVNDSGQSTYTGDGSSGVYVWGLQLEVGTASDTYHRTEGQIYLGPGATPKGLLIEEARTNIAPNSHEFTANAGVTRSASNHFAPDGNIDGDEFTISSGSSEAHQIGMSGLVGSDVTIGTVHTVSFFAKLLNGTPNLGVRGFGKGGFNQHPIFNLSNGTVANVGSSWESGTKIEDFGNGWFRCSCVVNPSAQFAPIIHVLESGDSTGVLTYTGNGTDKIALWGGQLEIGSFLTSHIPTSGGTATRNADVATMGPTTGSTELVTNGTFDTATDWTLSAGWSITGGQAVASSAAQFKGISSTALSLVAGRRYRASMDVASYTAGSVDMRYREGGSIIANTGNKSSTGTFTLDFTCTDAATPDINIQTRSSGSNTFAIDNVSVRELYPFEQYNPAEGTVVCEFERIGNTSFDYVWSFDDGTTSEAMSVLSLNATHVYFGHAAGGVNGLTFQAFGTVIGNDTSTGYAYQLDNTHIVLNRLDAVAIELSFTDTSIGVASVDRLGIGIRARDFVGHGNCLIKRLTYYPYRLNDDVCDSKVSSR